MFRTVLRTLTPCLVSIAILLLCAESHAERVPRIVEKHLNRTGVRLVVLDFYADWCDPCRKAMEEWSKVHAAMYEKGIRVIVIKEPDDATGACGPLLAFNKRPLQWTPDEEVCDFRNEMWESFEMPARPAHYLYDWQGQLLMKRELSAGTIINKARAWLRRQPTVYIGTPTSMDGSAWTGARTVRGWVKGELESLSRFPTTSRRPRRQSRQSGEVCDIGLEADTELVVKLSDRSGYRVNLTLMDLRKGCEKASVTLRSGGDVEGLVRRAVSQLVGKLIGRVEEDKGSLCRRESDCRRNEKCERGKCVPSQCHLDQDCPSGKICQQGLCAARPIPDRCSSNRDCPDGKECRGGMCVDKWVPPEQAEMEIVQFTSDPEGAVVMVDGKLVCSQTPCSKALAAGSYSLNVQKEKYLPHEDRITIRPGMRPVSVKLTPNFGWLSVTSEPNGLEVKLNGEKIGTTPIRRREMAPGVYQVEVADPKYVSETRRVSLNRDTHATEHFKLAAREGALQVSAQDERGNDVRADVFVDGEKVGRSFQVIKLMIGEHELKVSHRDNGDWTGKVTIRERQTERLRVKLASRRRALARVVSGSDGIEWVRVRGGSFLMGSPSNEPGRDNDEKQHRVRLSVSYELMKHEVTQGQFEKLMGYNPSRFSSCGATCPVEKVNWHEACAFANKMSAAARLDSCYDCSGSGKDVTCRPSRRHRRVQDCRGYRLPTEAEWEFAARAGTETPFSFGRCLSTSEANYDGNYPQEGCPKGEYRQRPVAVGSFRGNAWGIYDMHGNVWEWCNDWKGGYPSGSVNDPVGPSSGSYRVIRGGSWNLSAGNCRSAIRYVISPDDRVSGVGFRLARSVP
jgi:formylglycine-generating enzyme required for sulfatase activity/thiol-disulfide isomerase/thioredoxin